LVSREPGADGATREPAEGAERLRLPPAALGVRVLAGRAYPYGTGRCGRGRLRHCIDILAQRLRMTMQLCGAQHRRAEPRAWSALGSRGRRQEPTAG